MKVTPKTRTLTDSEKVVQAEYKLAQFTRLLALVGKEIGTDKIIEIAKSSDYPKTDDQVKAMIEQGKSLKDLPRHTVYAAFIDKAASEEDEKGDWVKWEDIEKIIG